VTEDKSWNDVIEMLETAPVNGKPVGVCPYRLAKVAPAKQAKAQANPWVYGVNCVCGKVSACATKE